MSITLRKPEQPYPSDTADLEPTKVGRERYEPDVRSDANKSPGTPCIFTLDFLRNCKGECGCPACREGYGDFLSSESKGRR